MRVGRGSGRFPIVELSLILMLSHCCSFSFLFLFDYEPVVSTCSTLSSFLSKASTERSILPSSLAQRGLLSAHARLPLPTPDDILHLFHPHIITLTTASSFHRGGRGADGVGVGGQNKPGALWVERWAHLSSLAALSRLTKELGTTARRQRRFLHHRAMLD